MLGSSALDQDQIVNGTYRIESLLGEGGMGRVYRAHQMSLDRVVALKILRLEAVTLAHRAEMERRFSLEASLCSRLSHPNIVTVFDHGRIDSGPNEGACFIAMEFLDGDTLGSWIRSQRLTPKLTVRFAVEIAQALHEAHENDVIHRDLKPDNVMLVRRGGQPVVKLVDFGLVRGLGAKAVGLTAAGTFLGTPAYMAPEQLNRGTIDRRTDVYSLGVVLFECLTGRLPFESDSPLELALAHLQAQVPSFRAVSPGVGTSPALELLVRQMLEKDPDKRPASAEEVFRLLRATPESDSAPRPATHSPKFVRTSARYQLGHALSRSTDSIVFEATHVELGRKVLLKAYPSFEERDSARLTREVQLLAELNHPNAARVLDTGSMLFDRVNVPFVVSDFIRGDTLRARLATSPMPASAVLALGAGLGEALAGAHQLRILHGAIDPDHVMLPPDRPESAAVLVSFGCLSGAERLSMAPHPHDSKRSSYHAPELSLGGRRSERTDLFALGALLHECWTGKPYAGALTPRPGATREEESLLSVIGRAVARSPGERFETATAFAAAVHLAMRKTAPESSGRASWTSPRAAHTLWVLAGDPALQRPAVVEAIKVLRGRFDVKELLSEDVVEQAKALAEGTVARPAVIVFGDLNVILEDPVLQAVRAVGSISRLLVSTHLNVDLLRQSINFCGVDQHVCLPETPEAIVAVATELLARTHESRRWMVAVAGESESSIECAS